jgi:hypothetical protein
LHLWQVDNIFVFALLSLLIYATVYDSYSHYNTVNTREMHTTYSRWWHLLNSTEESEKPTPTGSYHQPYSPLNVIAAEILFGTMTHFGKKIPHAFGTKE